jgi:hypothetical protein
MFRPPGLCSAPPPRWLCMHACSACPSNPADPPFLGHISSTLLACMSYVLYALNSLESYGQKEFFSLDVFSLENCTVTPWP